MLRASLIAAALIASLAPARAEDGCEKFAWSLARERAAFAAADKSTIAAGETLTALPAGALVIRLQPGAQASFEMPPERKPRTEQWHGGMDTYLLNVIRPTRLVAPIMVSQKAGAIVNISTAWVFEPSPMFPTSAVFRAGLAAFTKIFADQYAADNVRMNNVLPGWIDSLPETEERRKSVPMQRYGTSAFLASKDAAFITGQSLRVDGGMTRSV